MKYLLKHTDKKFLQAVDYIIAKHKSRGLEPSNDNAISLAIFGKRGVIAKIRSSSRGVTQNQIIRFATYFELDFNFFYRKEVYTPEIISRAATHLPTADTAEQFHLYLKGDNIGNIYNGQISIYLDKVKEFAANSMSKVPKEYLQTVEQIRQEYQVLELKLKNATDQLRMVEERFNKVILDLTTQLSEARKQENQYLRQLLQLTSVKDKSLLTNGTVLSNVEK